MVTSAPPQSPYPIPAPAIALFSLKSAAKISTESNPPLRRISASESTPPSFLSCLRLRQVFSLVISCSLRSVRPRRTSYRAAVRPLPSQARVGLPRFQSWPQVSSHRAPKRSGAFGLVSRALNRPNRELRPSPVMAPPRALPAPASQLPSLPGDLISAFVSRSNDHGGRIPLRPSILQKTLRII